MNRYEPVIADFNHILHGCDYNPEQWMNSPDILEEDMRLMKLAGINAVSIGIFAWSVLEPEEGEYDFSFFDSLMDRLNENGIKAILATPSGARPVWMAKKYPEVLRVNELGQRHQFGVRHNHCFTSMVYRQKVRQINTELAKRYRSHPALGAWHVSNEYNGTCYCDNCRKAFQEWLKNKYDNDINLLNSEWWTTFWSHTYSSFDEIDPPLNPMGDFVVHGHNLDWKRFTTYQTMDFFKNEIIPLREYTPDIKITTNFVALSESVDYQKFAEEVDVVSWDSYPAWHHESSGLDIASGTAFNHNVNRCLKNGQPFLLMESTPSKVCAQPTNKLKRPGMNALSAIQALAYGSDSVQYFQFRKGRGAWEKFHGAVVDHVGNENTRVFGEVAALGKELKKLDDIVGTTMVSEVAIIFDWQNRWAINDSQFLSSHNRNYLQTCQTHYMPFWKKGINTDIISEEQDFSKYKLVIAPMLYLLKPGVKKKISEYVSNGGTFVGTYLMGEVNENDLCYLGGFPAEELKEVFGIWAEDIDSLYADERNSVKSDGGKKYIAKDYCEIIHPSTAEVIASYTDDFYSGMAAVTKNNFGRGTAYYIAFRSEGNLEEDMYSKLIYELDIKKLVDNLPYGVTCTTRTDGKWEYIFIMNFNSEEKRIQFSTDSCIDVISGKSIGSTIVLGSFGYKILKKSVCN